MRRNKAVLNNSPDLPLLFLLLQLLIAVVLLHASAAVSKNIDIPRFEIQVAKKLVPVVLVNIVGLVFNTLCLRAVEASFFQVRRARLLFTRGNYDPPPIRLQEASLFP
jgi:GDP-fucose transporter C1